MAVTLAISTAIIPVLAAPSSTPPGGSVVPTFNGLNINNGANNLNIAATGAISNASGAVTVSDADGLTSTAAANPAIAGNSTSNFGVRGISNTNSGVAGFSTSGSGTSGSSTSGTGVNAWSDSGNGVASFSNTNAAVRATSNNIGVSSTAIIAGRFNYNLIGGASVDLGTVAAAVDATGVIRNANLTIAANGNIFNQVGTNPVTIADTDGVSFTNNAGALKAYLDGSNGDFLTTGDIDTPKDIGAGGLIHGATLLSIGNTTVGGNLTVTNNVDILGTIKGKTVGRFYPSTKATGKAIGAGNATSPSWASDTLTCPTGDFIVSCSITNTNTTTFLNDTLVNAASTSCTAYAANIGSAGAFTVTGVCFSPEG